MDGLKIVAAMLISLAAADATPILTPWTPAFKGIDRVVGTNTPGGGGVFTNLQVIHALRIDLTDPDVRLFTTPRLTNYVAEVQETGGLTVSDFLRTNQLQAAINANFFSPGQYYLPPGTPMVVEGLAVSEGVVVSEQEGPPSSSAIVFDVTNRASIIYTNWPATNTAGIFTAVSGIYPLLINGTNVGYSYLADPGFIHEPNPRTVMGLSQDRRYLFLVAIDGRQPGYSVGAYDYESAEWLLLLGASDGVNMDGGGSTTLVVQDTTGVPLPLNHSSAVANDPQGRERTVGSHFGVYARPAPGFINDVVALPDDTAASVIWTTLAPSTTQVQYDTTTNFTNSSVLQSALVTNHSALLTGLTPDTGYYFRALSSEGTNQYVSPNFFFVTTNYVTTNQLLEITNSWKFSTANLDGVNWTARDYNDSAWSGPGAGLLWVDLPPLNPLVEPKNTQMPVDPNNSGFPFVTYYLRTHFQMSNLVPGTILKFSSYLDDGAVLYLNGNEINRIRMDPNPTLIANDTLATDTPTGGDATTPDEFSISGNLITNLVVGDNVLAVEVHNFNQRSGDITFGASVVATAPYVASPQIEIVGTNGVVILSWSKPGFTLQQADDFSGLWTNVPGPVITSPYVISNSVASRYYQLYK